MGDFLNIVEDAVQGVPHHELTPLPRFAPIIGPALMDAFCDEILEMNICPEAQMKAIKADLQACKILEREGFF